MTRVRELRPEDLRTRRLRRWVMGLGLAVVVSAVAVVYAQYAGGDRYARLTELEARLDALEVEWGQLQLEQGAWATHSRIERLARERLGMKEPEAAEVVMVRLP